MSVFNYAYRYEECWHNSKVLFVKPYHLNNSSKKILVQNSVLIFWYSRQKTDCFFTIVFDRLHIESNLNKTISNIRKVVSMDETDLNKRKLIKGTRWLLLKNNQNLNEDKSEKEKPTGIGTWNISNLKSIIYIMVSIHYCDEPFLLF